MEETPIRKEARVSGVLPVRIYGIDSVGKPFNSVAHTLNVSKSGALLANVEIALNCGDVIGIQKGVYKGKFRVTWAGKKGSSSQGQIGVACIDGARNIWGLEDRPLSQIDELAESKRRYSSLPFTGERRSAPRHACDLGVQIKPPGSDVTLWSRCTDISQGGCYIDSRSPLVSGTEFELTLFLAGDSLALTALVRTSFPSMGMGVQFEFASEDQRVQLRRYLRERLGADESTAEPEETSIAGIESLSECVEQLRAWVSTTPLDSHDRNQLEALSYSLRRELLGVRAEMNERLMQRNSAPETCSAAK